MTIDVKLIATELAPGIESGTYNIEGGSTVRDIIEHCGAVSGTSVPEGNYEFMYPLFNSKPVTLGSTITENGTLHVCRVVMGG